MVTLIEMYFELALESGFNDALSLADSNTTTLFLDALMGRLKRLSCLCFSVFWMDFEVHLQAQLCQLAILKGVTVQFWLLAKAGGGGGRGIAAW